MTTTNTDFLLKADTSIQLSGSAKSKKGQNGVSGTALAIISTTMGGGIVSIPYAFASAGFVNGLLIQFCIVCAALVST
jgi:amino acid permease